MTQINTAERLAAKAFFVLFCKVTTNCNSTKPYNKSLINLVCSFCTGKYCLQFLKHRPRSFVARSVRKTSGNTSPYRPRTRLISPYYNLSDIFCFYTYIRSVKLFSLFLCIVIRLATNVSFCIIVHVSH